ncbi:MAG: ATP-binding protein [Oscillatoriaceae bacterium SKW80]|nr:ATP-binding protein [Oscillatoriaceae bacterium SKYG93]MCX8120901.1 ATP-binding protein [Oscillatoriaceae bacterium SKW80]MDW8452174.1 ATP-binding protein [Oscillatoriaceae cyanobacterium SKYGB_i_bin93]
MECQNSNTRAEGDLNGSAFREEKNERAQKHLSSLLKITKCLSLRYKICFGYALAFSIAILGTSTGLTIGNYYYQRAQQQGIKIDEETRRLSELYECLNHAKLNILQIITTTKLTPAQLQQQFQGVVKNQQRLKNVWAEMQAEADIKILPELRDFFNEYGETIEIYKQRLGEIAEIKLPLEETKVRELLLEFVNEPISRQVIEALEKMEIIKEIGDRLEDESRTALVKAEVLRVKIIIFSMIISSAIAFILALRTSKAIIRPLQELTKLANRITENANFDLCVTVKTNDEIGILANSFNQLIHQVKQLLEDQKIATERQIIQTEKLATLGRMIAEIAHEINNPIGCIYGNLQYVQKYFQGLLKIIEIYEKEISLPPQISESAAEIEVNYIKEDLPQLLLAMKIATERAKQLVYSLRNFSRLDEVKPHPVDLRSCLDSTLIILNSRIKNKIEVYCDYQEVPAAVEGYAGMLSQVFLNVISNAIEALEEKDSKEKREIRITTEKLNEKWVVVRIADNGVGITQENQAKIFDAFFTTKPQGIGTGLGLAISYQIIVEKHGGKINCYSQVGKGTEFVITLPVKFSLPAAAPISV